MATLGTMKSRIATELDRTDLTTPIASAIQDAIDEYEEQRFWFNESRDLTFSTVAAQRIYTSSDGSWIPNVVSIDLLMVVQSSINYDLTKNDAICVELENDSGAASGRPYEWAYFNKSIWLYPVPDAVYTVRALAHYRPADLASDDDTNVWTTEAERLIRRRAKQLLMLDMLDDGDGAAKIEPLIQQELSRLAGETAKRRSLGRVKSMGF